MTVDDVMTYRRAEPFRPFVLELKDGRRFVIREPTQVGRNPAYTQLGVAADDESIEVVDGSQLARVELLLAGPDPSGGAAT
jgi:hypothetical protein